MPAAMIPNPHQPFRPSVFHLYTPSWQLRSSADTWVFRIPSFRSKSSGRCSLSYQAPVIWNQLPVSVCHSTSVSSFKSSLKTVVFSESFSSGPSPWYTTVCACVCVCLCCTHMKTCTFKERVSAQGLCRLGTLSAHFIINKFNIINPEPK